MNHEKKARIKNLSTYVCLAVLTLTADKSVALSTAEVEQRLQMLEKQRALDQAEIMRLKQELQTVTRQPNVNGTNAKLEDRLSNLERKAKSQSSAVNTINRRMHDIASHAKVNGFISAYGVRAAEPVDTSGLGIGTDMQFNTDSRAGIQVDYNVSPRVDAVLQFVARGYEDFKVNDEWAFVRLKATNNLFVRMGRLRLPFYMYSESLDVGYTYPWVRPPIDVYLRTITNYDGIDMLYSFPIGDWAHNVQLLYGALNYKVRYGGMNTKGRNVPFTDNDEKGLVWTASYDAWTLRAGYFHGQNLAFVDAGKAQKNTIDIGYSPDTLQYYVAGIKYETEKWLVVSEYTHYVPGDHLPFSGEQAFYLGVGYHFSKLMPFVTYGKAYSDKADETWEGIKFPPDIIAQFSSVIPRYQQQSVTLGIRYDLDSGVALKAEVAKYSNFNGTPGNFDVEKEDLGNGNSRLDPNELKRLDRDGQAIFSVGVDAVF